MGREVRMVASGWEHPKDDKGRFIPLMEGSYSQRAAEWDFAREQWLRGLKEDWHSDRPSDWVPRDGETLKVARYTDWAGVRPSPDDYMPDWPEAEATLLMMYESTSEGTPISPAFATPEELARWLADSGASSFGRDTATYEQWLPICRGGWAPSMVMSGGVIQSGVAAMADLDADRKGVAA